MSVEFGVWSVELSLPLPRGAEWDKVVYKAPRT